MKNSQFNLLKVAYKLNHKYAFDGNKLKSQIQTWLEESITNASSVSGSGVEPFVQMLKEDHAVLSINVKRDGDKISVSPATVNPSSVADKYAGIPSQIKRYLEKNLDLYPIKWNESSVDYDDVMVTLSFG